jgi:hypothetical protein
VSTIEIQLKTSFTSFQIFVLRRPVIMVGSLKSIAFLELNEILVMLARNITSMSLNLVKQRERDEHR